MPWSVVAVASPRYCTSYRALIGRTAELLAALEGPDYDRATFERVRASRPADELGRAVRFLVVNRMSRGGLGESFAWSDRTRGGRPGDLNAWGTIRAELPRIADRLRGVTGRFKTSH